VDVWISQCACGVCVFIVKVGGAARTAASLTAEAPEAGGYGTAGRDTGTAGWEVDKHAEELEEPYTESLET